MFEYIRAVELLRMGELAGKMAKRLRHTLHQRVFRLFGRSQE
jgi:hypothetical protein